MKEGTTAFHADPSQAGKNAVHAARSQRRRSSTPVLKSTSASGGRPGSVERRGTDIATPSSMRRVDGVEVDAAIQDEGAVKF